MHSPRASKQDHSILYVCAAAAGATFVLLLWLCRPLIRAYFPTADDVAFQITSTAIGGVVRPMTWLTDGFHSYFESYTEWQVARTDFWRPLMNSFVWLNYELFGSAWGDQLIVGYAEHAIMVGMAGLVAYRILHLNRILTLAVMLIAALNPAFWSTNDALDSMTRNSPPELLQYPVFQIEMLCGILMLGAFIAFVSGRYALYCLCATIALMLKETALTVPIAAILLVGAWARPDARRAIRNLAWLVLPLALWGAGRAFIFHYGRAIYVLNSESTWGWLLKPVRNLLFLPSTLYRGPLHSTQDALRTFDLHTLLLHGFQLLANLAWWLALLYALYRAWKLFGRRLFTLEPAPWITGLVFAMGTFSLVLLLQAPDPRYLYFWFALGPAAIFAALANSRYQVAIGSLLSLTLLVPTVFSARQSLSADSLQNYDLVKHSGRLLAQMLASLPPQVRTVYILDDTVIQATAPAYFAKFAGFNGRIVVVNSVTPILGCHTDAPAHSRYQLVRSDAATQLQYTAPSCFYALNEAPLTMFDDHKDVTRGPWMTYHFPLMQLAGPISVLSGSSYDAGPEWSLTVTNPECATPGACVWLGLDPQRQVYYALD